MSLTKIPAYGLSPEHFQVLKDCVTRVVNTNIARQSYAQILDGAPNSSTSHYTVGSHNVHEETCDDAFRAWDTFRGQFSFEMLSFNATVIQAYQNATFKSYEFILRLLELVAIACHNIGIFLFKFAKGGLRPLELTTMPLPSYLPAYMFGSEILPPTAFSYGGYTNVEAYAEGVAECAGYWIEFEIFGGVVIFDRGQSGDECKSAFIHPGGDWMIAELLDSQLEDFLAFGLGESGRTEPPFPWKGEKWARRVDPYESFNLNIFRDRYERRPAGPRRRCMFRGEDFPELTENTAVIVARAGTGR